MEPVDEEGILLTYPFGHGPKRAVIPHNFSRDSFYKVQRVVVQCKLATLFTEYNLEYSCYKYGRAATWLKLIG